MSRIFTIINAGNQPSSPDLLGLKIEQETFDFHLASSQSVLAKASLANKAGAPLIQFVLKKFKGTDWTLNVDHFSVEEMRGTWSNLKNPIEEGDSWTATGTGAGESDDDEARAAYAK